MAAHNELGKAGEDAAVAYLERKGYLIRHRNWHSHHLELDIVAIDGDELVIVEVKTRTTTDYQEPEEAVNATKILRIVRAADAYIRRFELDMEVRFDIVTVVGTDAPFHIEHIEEAFYPPIC